MGGQKQFLPRKHGGHEEERKDTYLLRYLNIKLGLFSVSPWFNVCALRTGTSFLLLSLAVTAPALAEPLPADCPTIPAPPGYNMPLTVSPRLPAGPGMPQGGYAQFGLNVPTNGTTCEPAAPDLPRDILHGDTSTDILTGQPTGRVIIERR